MTSPGEGNRFPGPPGFTLPHVGGDVAYADMDDAVARSTLQSNGVELTADPLLAVLDKKPEVIAAAAARVLGADGEPRAAGRLRELAHGRGDSARAEAAYALARLGDPDGVPALKETLELPFEAYVAPMQAAGSLARLGDPSGAAVIERALRSSNDVIRMVACKQLFHFVPLDGADLGGGRRLDAWALFDRALHDRDSGIASQARVQLGELDAPEARERLR
jgi:HEAT repeat protein